MIEINSGEVIAYSVVIITLISLLIEFCNVFFGEEERYEEKIGHEEIEKKYINPNVQAKEIDI